MTKEIPLRMEGVSFLVVHLIRMLRMCKQQLH